MASTVKAVSTKLSESECKGSSADRSGAEAKIDKGKGSMQTWRCPDPGCKKTNTHLSTSCEQCTLPKHSAQQFKKGRDGGGGGQRGRGRGRGGDSGEGGWRRYQDILRKPPKGIDLINETVRMFQKPSRDLDAKNDKNERIVKLSRDVTSESKKIIFLLHRIQSKGSKDSVLVEAEKKLNWVKWNLLYKIARELQGEDPSRFIKAYTNGLQEYVEALSFYHYNRFDRLIQWKEVQDELTFGKKISAKNEDSEVPEGLDEPLLTVYVPMEDYMLGLADLTGEVMRQAIDMVGLGDVEVCFKLQDFLHEMHVGLLKAGAPKSWSFSKKLTVLKSNIKKVDNVCNTISVRGSEVPKDLLASYLKAEGQQQQQCKEDEVLANLDYEE